MADRQWHWYNWIFRFFPWSKRTQVAPTRSQTASASSSRRNLRPAPTGKTLIKSQTPSEIKKETDQEELLLFYPGFQLRPSQIQNIPTATKSLPAVLQPNPVESTAPVITKQLQNVPPKKDKGTQHPMLHPRQPISMAKYPVDDEEVLFEPELLEDRDYIIPWIKGVREYKPEDDAVNKNASSRPSSSPRPSIEIDDDLFTDPLQSRKDPFYAPYGFVICCCFQIAWGLIGMIQMGVLIFFKLDPVEFLLLDKNFSKRPPYYLLTAAVLTVTGGILGLSAIWNNRPFFFNIIPHFMWVIITMCLASSITANGNWNKPTTSTYYRLLEAVSLYDTDPSYLNEAFPDEDVNSKIWDNIQSKLKCCGVTSATDWVKLSKPTVPPSCCFEDIPYCTIILGNWTEKQKTNEDFEKNFNQITRYLFEEPCINMIADERKNHIRDWTTYPLIYLAFHLLMMFNLNYLAYLLQNEYKSWEGISRLEMFKTQSIDVFKAHMKVAFWNLIPFCYKTKKLKSERALHHLEAASSSSVAASTITDNVLQEVKANLEKAKARISTDNNNTKKQRRRLSKVEQGETVEKVDIDGSDPLQHPPPKTKFNPQPYKAKDKDFGKLRDSIEKIAIDVKNDGTQEQDKDQNKKRQSRKSQDKGQPVSQWNWKKSD